MKRAPRHHYFNPKDFHMAGKTEGLLDNEDLSGPNVYVPKDIGEISHSDLLICYAEADNPGAGYLFEMGYAAGVGVPYVFINEQTIFPEKYMSMYIWASVAYYTVFDWTPKVAEYVTKNIDLPYLIDEDTESFLGDLRTDGIESFLS